MKRRNVIVRASAARGYLFDVRLANQAGGRFKSRRSGGLVGIKNAGLEYLMVEDCIRQAPAPLAQSQFAVHADPQHDVQSGLNVKFGGAMKSGGFNS